MNFKFCIVLGFLLVIHSLSYGQVKKSETEKKIIKTPTVTSSSDSLSKYHRNGIELEQRLSNAELKKDQNLDSKEFIIERSSNIRIEYKPEKKSE